MSLRLSSLATALLYAGDRGWRGGKSGLKVLHSLIGYAVHPAGEQVIWSGVVLGVVMSLCSRVNPKYVHGKRLTAGAVVLVAATGLLGLLSAQSAHAEFKIRSPNVDYREVEIEHNFSTTFDKRP